MFSSTISASVAAVIVLSVSVADGHSYLVNPQADWTDVKQPECRVGKPEGPQFDYIQPMNCPGPCGDTGKDSRGASFFSTEQGKTTLARGQKLYMKWTRNNHESGFVRFTLVPKSKRMDKGVHDMFAFHYACWEAGEIGCATPDECGTDQKGLRYQTEVEIPRVFPDGEYILGWSWYGGTQYKDGSQKAEFGDYWSCANVVVHGGIDGNGTWQDDKSNEAMYTPVFVPGMNDKSQTQCFSATNKLGMCATEPCYDRGTLQRYEGRMQVPAEFENGQSPPPVRAADILAITGGTGSTASTASTASTTSTGSGGGASASVPRFELVDVTSGQVINYDFSSQLDVTGVKESMSLRVVADPADNIKAVYFYVGDRQVQVEGVAPYYIAGDSNNVPNPWRADNNPPLNVPFKLSAKVVRSDGTEATATVYPFFTTQ
jgi:hypothetical protein